MIIYLYISVVFHIILFVMWNNDNFYEVLFKIVFLLLAVSGSFLLLAELGYIVKLK